MSKFPFSQLIREIFIQAQGLFTPRHEHAASKFNAELDQNFLTLPGGPTIADFFVASPWSVIHTFVVASRNLGYSRGLQLRKEGI